MHAFVSYSDVIVTLVMLDACILIIELLPFFILRFPLVLYRALSVLSVCQFPSVSVSLCKYTRSKITGV